VEAQGCTDENLLGQKVDEQASQYTQDRRLSIVDRYDEGCTNAVRRPVSLA
jgi:hypothetical protein